jgi:HAD superfamily hydrolase (TIGR01509 family)
MIKGITFDLDGVYFKRKKSFLDILVDLGVSLEKAKEIFSESKEMNKFYKTGKMNDNEFWTWAIKEWNLNISVEEIIKLLIDSYQVNEEVVEVVRKLRERGYKTLICSNNFPARIEGLDKRFNFLNDFDVSVFSYQVGWTKPNKEIFQELVNQSGLKPEEIVFSDDDETKMIGAKEIGINTFLFTNFEEFLESLKKLEVNI